VFRAAFPNLGHLAELSPLSQGMIVGIVPRDDRLAFKIYFNTRIDLSAGHRQRVAQILGLCGLEDKGFYDLLYAKNDGARFHGIGIDLGGDESRRAKLYVRMDDSLLMPTLEALASRLQPDRARALKEIIHPALDLVESVRGEALVDEVELAVAIASDRPTTAKLAVFWASKGVGDKEMQQVRDYVARIGYPGCVLDEAVRALSETSKLAQAQEHPLHGIGIEVPVGERPKINVYLQPVL